MLWSIEHALTWEPSGGGSSRLSIDDVARMDLRKVYFWLDRTKHAREQEAEAIRKAREEAKAKQPRRRR